VLEGRGCVVSRNGLMIGTAGTLIIDSPSLCKFFTGQDIPLAPTQGYIQLRRYNPKDPARSPFQVFNFYLKSGPDYAFNTELVSSLLGIDCSLPSLGAT
jgi:hypothetical protein